MTLPPTEVHIWYVFTEQVINRHLLARYALLLSPEEHARWRRFVFEQHRHSFLVSHALQRCVLSLYADVAPEQWTFQTASHGKPHIAGPASAPALCFNLSHTTGLAAMAVACEREVGVDVEHVKRRTVSPELADRYFAPEEAAQLRQLPGERQQEAFFDFWTLKEAYIKARGLGLALPLDGFRFHLQPPLPPNISFTQRVADDPSAWQFAQYRPGPAHKLSLAVLRPGASDLTITLRPMVPMMGIEGS
jgi:4'-phosphopantetheinyl transferase